MDWVRVLVLITAGANMILLMYDSMLIGKTKRNLNEVCELLELARALPDVVPCYECRFYLEDEPFCPKSGMKMKDGLIYCCYGEREEEGSDEGINDDNG